MAADSQRCRVGAIRPDPHHLPRYWSAGLDRSDRPLRHHLRTAAPGARVAPAADGAARPRGIAWGTRGAEHNAGTESCGTGVMPYGSLVIESRRAGHLIVPTPLAEIA